MTVTSTARPETPTEPASHRTTYIVIGVVVAVLAIIGVLVYDTASDDQEAQAKAQQLVQAFRQAGLRTPTDTDQIVASLGTDGGAVCANPANALGKATLLDSLANGASFVGRRPLIVDRRIVLGEALILQVYCPDKLQPFKDKIDALKYDTTLKP